MERGVLSRLRGGSIRLTRTRRPQSQRQRIAGGESHVMNLPSRGICMWISTVLERCLTNKQADRLPGFCLISLELWRKTTSLCENPSPRTVTPPPICHALYLTFFSISSFSTVYEANVD